MNAIPFPRRALPPVQGDAAYAAACAVHADAHIRCAMELLGDQIGAIYAQRRGLTHAEQRTVAAMRNALVALSHASSLLVPLSVERAP